MAAEGAQCTRLAQETGGASGFRGRLDWPSFKVGGLSIEPRSTQSGAGSASRSQWLPAKCPEAVRASRTPRALLCVGPPYSKARAMMPKTSPQSRAKSSGLLKETTSSRAPCRVTPFLASGAWPKPETCKATCRAEPSGRTPKGQPRAGRLQGRGTGLNARAEPPSLLGATLWHGGRRHRHRLRLVFHQHVHKLLVSRRRPTM